MFEAAGRVGKDGGRRRARARVSTQEVDGLATVELVEDVGDVVAQLVELDRLGEVVVEAGPDTLLDDVAEHVGREGYDGGARVAVRRLPFAARGGGVSFFPPLCRFLAGKMRRRADGG